MLYFQRILQAGIFHAEYRKNRKHNMVQLCSRKWNTSLKIWLFCFKSVQPLKYTYRIQNADYYSNVIFAAVLTEMTCPAVRGCICFSSWTLMFSESVSVRRSPSEDSVPACRQRFIVRFFRKLCGIGFFGSKMPKTANQGRFVSFHPEQSTIIHKHVTIYQEKNVIYPLLFFRLYGIIYDIRSV